MSSLALLSASNYPASLIPLAHEPAFAVYSTANSVWVMNHHKVLIGEYHSAGDISNQFNASVATQLSTTTPAGYAFLGSCSMHGHAHLPLTPQVHGNHTSTGFGRFAPVNPSHNWVIMNGIHNSRSTGVWANKTKRDNLCLQRFENTGNVGYTFSGTQVAHVGWGAIDNPLTSSRMFSSGNNSFNANTSYGLIGYNETSKMLCVAGHAASGSITMYVYKNVAAPNYQTCMDGTFWSASNIVHGSRITVSFSITVADILDYQHFKIIPLDDGNIRIVNKHQGNSIRTFLLTGNSGLTSTSWTKGAEATQATTTSYHDSASTSHDALTHLTTYDGKYTVCMTPYYYYGCGMSAIVVRHSDGKYYKIGHTNTSTGFTASMIGANTFLVCHGTNFDGGAAAGLYEYNLGMIYGTATAEATDITTYYITGVADSPTASTSYGGIFPVVSTVPIQVKGIV